MLKTIKRLALAAALIGAPLVAQAGIIVHHTPHGTVVQHVPGYGVTHVIHQPVYVHPYGYHPLYGGGYHQHCVTSVRHGLLGAHATTHCF